MWYWARARWYMRVSPMKTWVIVCSMLRTQLSASRTLSSTLASG